MRKRTGIILHFRCFAAFQLGLIFSCCLIACGQPLHTEHTAPGKISVGAEVLLMEKIQHLTGKKIALVTNHTGLVNDSLHLVDTLPGAGVQLVKIFAPEHGFRGEAEAGAHIEGGIDARSGLPLISLYGNKKQPSAEDLRDVDLVLFDIQDVGTRFYTYLSTMVYVMEACAESDKVLWILDRPNPNGFYIDGPVLKSEYTSFVGLHPVPVVHGMTLGEYARMVNGEGWLKNQKKCRLEVIPTQGYTHDMRWEETGRKWIPPSPNLPTALAAAWYPVLCWYEGTPVSVGRGTESPFELAGAPWHVAFRRRVRTDSTEGKKIFKVYGNRFLPLAFVPASIPGKAAQPLFEGQTCYGVQMLDMPSSGDSVWLAGLQLLGSFYQDYSEQKISAPFFQPFFRKLAGTDMLEKQIKEDLSPDQIRNSWQPEIAAFRKIRAKYLMYK